MCWKRSTTSKGISFFTITNDRISRWVIRRQQRSTSGKRKAFEKGGSGVCCGSTECALALPGRSWHEISRRKPRAGYEERKKERGPVETDAADGNPQRARIPTAA